jgi:hypothetical protein
LSKSLAKRFGEQEGKESTVELCNNWVERNSNELHEKVNNVAVVVRCGTGVELGHEVNETLQEIDRDASWERFNEPPELKLRR